MILNNLNEVSMWSVQSDKIKQNKKEKFVVRFASGKRFYRGLDFDEALEVFEETYEDKCVE